RVHPQRRAGPEGGQAAEAPAVRAADALRGADVRPAARPGGVPARGEEGPRPADAGHQRAGDPARRQDPGRPDGRAPGLEEGGAAEEEVRATLDTPVPRHLSLAPRALPWA